MPPFFLSPSRQARTTTTLLTWRLLGVPHLVAWRLLGVPQLLAVALETAGEGRGAELSACVCL